MFLFPSRADYDFDGKVDAFEDALFFLEMEEEDKEIAEGRSFFGSALCSESDLDDLDDLDDFDDLFDDDDDY